MNLENTRELSEKYSLSLRESRRGTNSLPKELVIANALRGVVRVLDKPELWPVLDVGCGEGYHVQKYIERGIPTVGVDIDSSDYGQLREAQKRSIEQIGTRIPLIGAGARHLPFKDDAFGRVESRGMIMMIPYAMKKLYDRELTPDEAREEVKKAVYEMKRVVKPRGQIYIITFADTHASIRDYFSCSPEEFKQIGMEVGLIPLHVDYHETSPDFIDALFQKPT